MRKSKPRNIHLLLSRSPFIKDVEKKNWQDFLKRPIQELLPDLQYPYRIEKITSSPELVISVPNALTRSLFLASSVSPHLINEARQIYPHLETLKVRIDPAMMKRK